jgi:hypothetical protein
VRAAVLRVLVKANQPLTCAEIVGQAHVNRVTAERILADCQAMSWVERMPSDTSGFPRYRATIAGKTAMFAVLLNVVMREVDERVVSSDVPDDLTRTYTMIAAAHLLDEPTASLAVRFGGEAAVRQALRALHVAERHPEPAPQEYYAMVRSAAAPPTTRSHEPSGPAAEDGPSVAATAEEITSPELVQRYNNGETIRDLAAATGRSYHFIRTTLAQAGVTFRQHGGARPHHHGGSG